MRLCIQPSSYLLPVSLQQVDHVLRHRPFVDILMARLHISLTRSYLHREACEDVLKRCLQLLALHSAKLGIAVAKVE